jgi:hypothetical protein
LVQVSTAMSHAGKKRISAGTSLCSGSVAVSRQSAEAASTRVAPIACHSSSAMTAI